MMVYRNLLKDFLAEFSGKLRRERGLTQEKMSEQLRITSCAYGNLERGKYCFAATTLVSLLLMLKDNELEDFLSDFREKVDELEHSDIVS